MTDPVNREKNIYDVLHRLGVTANYKGFFQLAFAVQLCVENPERLHLVTKLVYPDVAKRYCTSWKAVERNIRTVSRVAWNEGRPLLDQMAGRSLTCQPSTARLLAILSYDLFPAVHSSLVKMR